MTVVCYALVLALLTSSPGSRLAAGPSPMAFVGLDLPTAQRLAVDQSPDVAVARSNVTAARALRTQAWAAFLPTATTGYTSLPQAGSGAESIKQSTHSVGLDFSVSDLVGLPSSAAQAAAALRSAEAGLAAAAGTERLRVSQLFFDALRTRAILEARQNALILAQAERAAAQKRFAVGAVPHIDVIRADVAQARAMADVDAAQAAADNALDGLRAETGVGLSALAGTVSGSEPPLPAAANDPNAAASLALGLRPEIAAAFADVSAMRAGIANAALAALPTVTLGAGYNRGVDSGKAISGSAVSATVAFPLSRASGSRLAQARAGLGVAQAKLTGIKRQIGLEAAAAVRNLQATSLATAAHSRAREAAAQELAAAELGYAHGVTTSLELGAARSTFAGARVDELAALYAEALARATLAVAVGK